jgi:hypothetical protein
MGATGTTFTTGSPRFVTTISPRPSATKSMSSRHRALNADAGITGGATAASETRFTLR